MPDVEVLPDADAAVARAAEVVADRARVAIEGGRSFAWAISGGTTPAAMFRRLGELGLAWSRIDTWQVDERVAPLGDDDRNRSEQERALPPDALARVRWMPVEDPDLRSAAERYAASLPERFDVVHLGLGPDGHTASLVPGDPVLDVGDRAVAVTDPYEGRRRMTLTYPGLSRSRSAVWLVTGAAKRDAVRKLVDGDASIPATRVAVAEQLLVADRAAFPDDLRR